MVAGVVVGVGVVGVVVVSGCFCRGLAYSGVVAVRVEAAGLLSGVRSAPRAAIAAEGAERVAWTTAGGGGGGGAGDVVVDTVVVTRVGL